MRASTLFGMTIAILIGMAVVFGVKSAGLFDRKLPPPVNPDRPKILVPFGNLFRDNAVTRPEEGRGPIRRRFRNGHVSQE